MEMFLSAPYFFGEQNIGHFQDSIDKGQML